MEEIWKDIKGYEEYKISSFGNVKSFKRKNIIYMKTFINRYGYVIVRIGNNIGYKGFKIHRLVAQAFIKNPKNKPQVNHIDGNKDNNRIENLEWNSCSENNLHSFNVLGRKPTYGNKGNTLGKNSMSKKVNQYTKDGKLVNSWDCIKEAGLNTNIAQQSIGKVCLGYRKTAGGFIWKYNI